MEISNIRSVLLDDQAIIGCTVRMYRALLSSLWVKLRKDEPTTVRDKFFFFFFLFFISILIEEWRRTIHSLSFSLYTFIFNDKIKRRKSIHQLLNPSLHRLRKLNFKGVFLRKIRKRMLECCYYLFHARYIQYTN